jgi:hypothetical protein
MLHGASLNVDPEAKIRPLANQNYRNAAEKAKVNINLFSL